MLFRSVVVQPSGTWYLGRVSIARDTDLDGTVDATSNLPVPVSGICANGVVSCQPGSWNGCSFYRWDVDAAKALKLTSVDMPKRSEEHTSEIQSLMRISYAVFCLKKKKKTHQQKHHIKTKSQTNSD